MIINKAKKINKLESFIVSENEDYFSIVKKICSEQVLRRIQNIYLKNNLSYTYVNYSKRSSINKLIPYLKNDKKNNDNKINFILLKNIGKTAMPNKNKISIQNLKNLIKIISQY